MLRSQQDQSLPVHAVAPPFELDDRASAIATALANADPDALAAILRFKQSRAD